MTGEVDALAFEVLLRDGGRGTSTTCRSSTRTDRPVGLVTTTDLLRLEQANPVYLAGDIAKQVDVVGRGTGVESTAPGRAVARRAGCVGGRHRPGRHGRRGCRGAPAPRARRGRPRAPSRALLLGDARLASPPRAGARGRPGHRHHHRRPRPARPAALVRGTGPTGDRRPRHLRLPALPRRRHGDEPPVAPAPAAVAAAVLVLAVRARARRGPGGQHLLRHAPVHGDAALHARLQRHVLTASPGSRSFLAQLAKHATSNEPPFGFFRGLVLEKAGDHKDTLDIKRGGVGAVVELARVHALSIGSPAVNTQARIEAVRRAGVLGDERAHDLRDAFEFISYVRLRHQAAQVRRGDPTDNFVAPDDLSGFDKRHLREAFAIVRQCANGARAPVPDAVHLVSLFRRTPDERRVRALRDRVGPGPLRDYLAVPLPHPGDPGRRPAPARRRHRDHRPGPAQRPPAVDRLGTCRRTSHRARGADAGRRARRCGGRAAAPRSMASPTTCSPRAVPSRMPWRALLPTLAGRRLLAHFARHRDGLPLARL